MHSGNYSQTTCSRSTWDGKIDSDWGIIEDSWNLALSEWKRFVQAMEGNFRLQNEHKQKSGKLLLLRNRSKANNQTAERCNVGKKATKVVY